MNYLVSQHGKELGPLTLDEIVAKVRDKELELFDYIFEDSKQDWVLLMEHSALSQKLKSNKPPRPPQSVGTGTTSSLTTSKVTIEGDAHGIAEWFVLKGENKFGPFSYTDVVKMLQQKIVFPFDFIWHASMEQWKRVAEISDFTEENIRKLYSDKSTAKRDVFLERQFRRKKFEGRVIVHDNMSLWRGAGFEISKGGVGITMSNSLVVPGQQVYVHFNSHGEFPPFNAVCEVVSKKFVNDTTPIQYGLRFLSLSQEVQEEFYKKVA